MEETFNRDSSRPHPPPPPPPPPHSPTYDALVAAGSRLRPLQQVHARMLVSGLHHVRSLATKLITLACATGSAHYTRCLLYSAPSPDSFLFNSLIRVASRSALAVDAIAFYRLMWLDGIWPCSYTFTPVVKACADLSAVRVGRMVHCHAVVNGFDSDCFVQTALVSLYAKCGDVAVARMVFDRIPERKVVAWNTIISGYEQNGLAEEAVEVFFQMRRQAVEPDSTTLVSLLSACSQLGQLDLGQWVNDYIVEKGLELNVVLGTSLINMYSRCSNVPKARQVFDKLKERNVVAWTAMISGYAMHGHGRQAIDLFHLMRSSKGPTPNNVTFIAVLTACAHAGLVTEGRKLFNSMTQYYNLVPGVEHHVCMVDMLGRAGLLNEAIGFINNSIPGKPGPAVWTAMLGACNMHKNFHLGVEVAEHLLAIEPGDPGHYVMLSNAYALVGQMDKVAIVRNSMVRKRLKKQVSYSLVEVDGVCHIFRMGDKSHPRTSEIYRCLEELMGKAWAVEYASEKCEGPKDM